VAVGCSGRGGKAGAGVEDAGESYIGYTSEGYISCTSEGCCKIKD
jgi:hypothetical protein